MWRLCYISALTVPLLVHKYWWIYNKEDIRTFVKLIGNPWKRIHDANTCCVTIQPENGLGGSQHCRAVVRRLPDHGDPQRRMAVTVIVVLPSSMQEWSVLYSLLALILLAPGLRLHCSKRNSVSTVNNSLSVKIKREFPGEFSVSRIQLII